MIKSIGRPLCSLLVGWLLLLNANVDAADDSKAWVGFYRIGGATELPDWVNVRACDQNKSSCLLDMKFGEHYKFEILAHQEANLLTTRYFDMDQPRHYICFVQLARNGQGVQIRFIGTDCPFDNKVERVVKVERLFNTPVVVGGMPVDTCVKRLNEVTVKEVCFNEKLANLYADYRSMVRSKNLKDQIETFLAECASKAPDCINRVIRNAYEAMLATRFAQKSAAEVRLMKLSEQLALTYHPGFNPVLLWTGRNCDGSNGIESIAVQIKELPHRPQAFIGLEKVKCSIDSEVFFSLFEEVGEQIKVIDRVKVKNPFDGRDSFRFTSTDRSTQKLSFDTARYDISASERAFGFRIKEYGIYRGKEHYREILVLYRLVDNKLAMVFQQPVETSELYHGYERAILYVDRPKGKPFFEWRLVQKVDGEKGQQRITSRYIWNGKSFSL